MIQTQRLPATRFKVGDRVYSHVHHRVKTVTAVRWKPADKQWPATWMYKLDGVPDVWLYESVLSLATEGEVA